MTTSGNYRSNVYYVPVHIPTDIERHTYMALENIWE